MTSEEISNEIFVTPIMNSGTFGSYKKAPIFLAKNAANLDALFMY